MGKLIKWLLGLVLILVVLVVAAVVILPQVIDPNDYKDQIVAKVKEATGRDLEIRDRLELKVFPSLAVQLGGVSLSNAPGFGDEPFARVEKLDLKVKLLPLLSKRVEVDTVVLQGLGLNLAKDAKGRTNWADLAGEGEPAEQPAEETAADGASGISLAVQGVQIEGARVSWDDRQAAQRVVLDDVNLSLGTLEPGADVPVSAKLRLTSDQPQLTLVLGLDGTVSVSRDLKQYSADGLKLSLDASGAGLPKDGVALTLTSNLAMDQTAGSLSLDELSLQGPEIRITGNLAVTDMQAATPKVDARFKLQESNLRRLLASFGVALDTADADALSRVSGDVGLKMAGGGATVEPLALKLDASTLTGKVQIPSFEGPVVRATVTLDEIDLDRYLPPPAADEPAKAESGKPADVPGNPFAGLRTLDLDATATVGKLKVNKLNMSEVKAVIKSKGGVLRIDPATAKLYDGSFKGLVELDARQAKPKVRLKETLAGIQVGPLLQDLVGEQRLVGTGEVEADVRIAGLSENEIRRSLNGTTRMQFRDGAVKGINLAKLIRNAKSALGMASDTTAVSDADQTDFSELSASAVITNGVIENQDLVGKSPLLRVEGKGRVDLPQDTLDYLVVTTLVSSLEGQGGKGRDQLSGVPIPVRFKGSLQNPKPTVDLQAALSAEAKQKIEEQKDELRGKVEEKAKAEFGDALKGLFGK